jgi:hypothetical protein
MSSAANNWNATESDESFHWQAELPWGLPPAILLRWQDSVLAAGEKHRIYRIEAIDWIGYRRERDGYIGDYLRAHPDRVPPLSERLPKGFVLGPGGARFTMPQYETTSLLSYVTLEGQIVEVWTRDMGDLAVLARLHKAPPGYPPVTVTVDGGFADWPDMRDRWAVFAVSSDIWFPWNANIAPVIPAGTLGDEPLDNRVLSRINGGRLNAFLRDVRDATLDAGGRWTSATWFDPQHPQADEHGVILDAPRRPLSGS